MLKSEKKKSGFRNDMQGRKILKINETTETHLNSQLCPIEISAINIFIYAQGLQNSQKNEIRRILVEKNSSLYVAFSQKVHEVLRGCFYSM